VFFDFGLYDPHFFPITMARQISTEGSRRELTFVPRGEDQKERRLIDNRL
jgi:hypothetical protein